MGLVGDPDAITGGAGNPAITPGTTPDLGARFRGDVIPMPEVKGECQICKPEDDYGIVSPQGLLHVGDSYGMTLCGKDATGDGWWWPL